MGRFLHMVIPTLRVRYKAVEVAMGVTSHAISIHFVWMAIHTSVTFTATNLARIYRESDDV